MSQVKTTLIERIEIDRDRVALGFGLWRVGYQDYRDKSERDKRLASLASDIYAAGRVLALQRHGKAQSFYVLMRLGERLELTDSRLTLASMDLQQADTWLIANLLVKALPMQLKDSPAQQSVSRFEAEGLQCSLEKLPGHASRGCRSGNGAAATGQKQADADGVGENLYASCGFRG